MSAYDIMLPSMSEIDSKVEAAQQQKIEDFRKNAAFNALVHTYGPAAGDPQAYGQMQAADMAKQKLPGELQSQQLENQGKQLENEGTQRTQQQQTLSRAAQLYGTTLNPDGSGDPAQYDKLFGNPLVQQATGLTPQQIEEAKPIFTGPGARDRLTQFQRAMIGPQPLSGAFSYGTDQNGQSVAIGHDKFGNPIVQPLNGITPTAVANSQSQAANRTSQEANRAVTTQPLGVRSNNPLNLQPGGKETTFANGTAGMLAASENLDHYAATGATTVRQIIGRWAPPTDAHGKPINNTGAYVADVAKRIGVSPDTQLNLRDPNVKGALMEAMAQHENGQAAPTASINPAYVAAQSAKAHATAQAQADVAGQKAANTAVGKAQGAAAAQGILGKQDIARAQEQATNADIRFSSAIANLQQARKYSDQAGSIAFATQHVPGSSGANFASTLNSVHSDIVNNVINSYKESTPKGQASGVGRVMSSEIKLWQDAYAAVNINQSPSLRAQNLQRLTDVTNRLRSASRAYFKQGFGVSASGAAPTPSSGGWSIKQVQ